MSLELSDELSQLANDFDQFSHGGIIMDGDTVFGIVARLNKLKRLARKLENETSPARADRSHEMHRVLDEVTRPGSNVKLFPVIHRPFSDGQPHGAA